MQKNTAKNTSKNLQDWHRADVVAALKKSGWSLRELARQAGLGETTLYTALDRPYPRAECIIADALGMMPEDIWPQRYARRSFKPVLTLRKAANA